MKRLLLFCVVLGLAGSLARATTPLLISSDVPTTESATLTTLLQTQAFRYDTPPAYTLLLTIPGNPQLDGIHKMDRIGSWLFSVETANNLAGVLAGADADPRDVIRYDATAGVYSFFFCGAGAGIPAGVNVDAVYLEGGDGGSLIVSFDVPVSLGAFTFDPADLVRYNRIGPLCGDWALAAANPDFDASAAGTGIPTSVNMLDAARAGALRIFSLDVPADLGPPGIVTYVPGQIVSWNGAAFALYEPLAGWPLSSTVDGLSTLGNPGVVGATLFMNKTASPQLDLSDVIVSWTASCSEGASNYGIYEGIVGTWYSHTFVDCDDGGAALTEQITPNAGSRYYLVVPLNPQTEGSYGQRRDNPIPTLTERPIGTAQCITVQTVTPCP
jgi:hypothetical protein